MAVQFDEIASWLRCRKPAVRFRGGACAALRKTLRLRGVRKPANSPMVLKYALSPAEQQLAGRLRRHVEILSEAIGERNTDRPGGLEAAARYIEDHLKKHGFVPQGQIFRAAGQNVRNIEVEIPGVHRRKKSEILLLGAH